MSNHENPITPSPIAKAYGALHTAASPTLRAWMDGHKAAVERGVRAAVLKPGAKVALQHEGQRKEGQVTFSRATGPTAGYIEVRVEGRIYGIHRDDFRKVALARL